MKPMCLEIHDVVIATGADPGRRLAGSPAAGRAG